jgi:putative transport protein
MSHLHPILILFLILAGGSWLGKLSVKGISLGTVGILFVALFFGHHGLRVPKEIMELGLLLFVYAVGLSAAPRFFRTFKRRGTKFVLIGGFVGGVGAAMTILVYRWLSIPKELASGLFTGALTCTPALAAAVEAAEKLTPGNSSLLPAGYGIAYPFSMIGVVILAQTWPKLAKKSVEEEVRRWKADQEKEMDKTPDQPGRDA